MDDYKDTANTNDTAHADSSRAPKWRTGVAMLTTQCLFVLLAANLLLLAWSPLAKVDPDSLPAAHTWVWWATQEYLKQPKPPQVVLLGSSLVMHPVSRRDADYLGQDIDYVVHHRSNYMEHELAQRGIGAPVCYNFALPGGMVSDNYMIARAFFASHKPAVIVLGLSVRDFIDNGVHTAGATPAFKYLKRFTTIDDLVDISMPQVFQKFDYFISNNLYLWGKKLDLQVMLAEKAKQNLSPFFAAHFPPSRLDEADPQRNQPSNLRSEVEEGMMIVRHDQPYSYEDNSAEYKRRYRSPNTSMFGIQCFFFNKLLDLCDQNNIKVVIVNMPLTPANHALMPQGSYDKYIDVLAQSAKSHHCAFVDLDAAHTFDTSNYYDTSHMNGSGGKKLVDALVSTLTSDQELATAIKRTASSNVASQGASF